MVGEMVVLVDKEVDLQACLGTFDIQFIGESRYHPICSDDKMGDPKGSPIFINILLSNWIIRLLCKSQHR